MFKGHVKVYPYVLELDNDFGLNLNYVLEVVSIYFLKILNLWF